MEKSKRRGVKIIKKLLTFLLVITVCAISFGIAAFRSPSKFFKCINDLYVRDAGISFNEDDMPVYKQLSSEGQKAYRLMYDALTDFEESVYVPVSSASQVKDIYYAVLQDNPQIYWAEKLSTFEGKIIGKTFYMCVEPQYCYTKEQTELLQPAIDAYADACLSGLPEGEYEAALYIHDYIIEHTDYVKGSADNQNILSVFVNGESVCGGYAKALQYLYKRAGIPCVYISGTIVENGENHAWNVTEIEGDFYQLDVTWDDPVYSDGGGEQRPASHKYFLITSAEMNVTHSVNTEYPYNVPECSAVSCNYFVKEGKYFTEYSYDGVYDVIQKAVSEGENEVEIKFSDRQTYETAVSRLIDSYDAHSMINRAEGGEGGGRTVYYSSEEELFIVKIRW